MNARNRANGKNAYYLIVGKRPEDVDKLLKDLEDERIVDIIGKVDIRTYDTGSIKSVRIVGVRDHFVINADQGTVIVRNDDSSYPRSYKSMVEFLKDYYDTDAARILAYNADNMIKDHVNNRLMPILRDCFKKHGWNMIAVHDNLPPKKHAEITDVMVSYSVIDDTDVLRYRQATLRVSIKFTLFHPSTGIRYNIVLPYGAKRKLSEDKEDVCYAMSDFTLYAKPVQPSIKPKKESELKCGDKVIEKLILESIGKIMDREGFARYGDHKPSYSVYINCVTPSLASVFLILHPSAKDRDNGVESTSTSFLISNVNLQDDIKYLIPKRIREVEHTLILPSVNKLRREAQHKTVYESKCPEFKRNIASVFDDFLQAIGVSRDIGLLSDHKIKYKLAMECTKSGLVLVRLKLVPPMDVAHLVKEVEGSFYVAPNPANTLSTRVSHLFNAIGPELTRLSEKVSAARKKVKREMRESVIFDDTHYTNYIASCNGNTTWKSNGTK